MRRHLRSANRHLLAVPRFPLNTYGRRAFSVGGPMAWNALPYSIRDPTSSTDCSMHLRKTYLFARVTSASSARRAKVRGPKGRKRWWGSWGAASPSPLATASGEYCELPCRGPGRSPAAIMCSCILEAPDDLSGKLLGGQVRRGFLAPPLRPCHCSSACFAFAASGV